VSRDADHWTRTSRIRTSTQSPAGTGSRGARTDGGWLVPFKRLVALPGAIGSDPSGTSDRGASVIGRRGEPESPHP
jgi:hypothetical protein